MTEVENFAKRLRRLREEQGLSVADLARAAGASEGGIRQLESGTVKSPNFQLGLRLAEALHVEPRFLAIGNRYTTTEHLSVLEKRLDALEKWLDERDADNQRRRRR